MIAGFGNRLLAALLRLALFAAVWWALSEGDPQMWKYGVVTVPVATGVSLALLRPTGRRVLSVRRVFAIGGLLWWFIRKAVLGGIDVARRAVVRRVDVTPGVIEYRFGTHSEAGRVAIAALNSLMPGTLSVNLVDGVLRVHALDTTSPVHDQVAELERRVRRVIGD